MPISKNSAYRLRAVYIWTKKNNMPKQRTEHNQKKHYMTLLLPERPTLVGIDERDMRLQNIG